MAYRAKNGKTYPYKEMRWQYKERHSNNNDYSGCFGLAIIIGILVFIFG